MFRNDLLRRALEACPEATDEATDEASAIEAMGLQPLLVPGARENFKITAPEDLALMRRLLVDCAGSGSNA